MTQFAWKLVLEKPHDWNTISEEQKIDLLALIAESIDMFGDFEGMAEF